MRCHCRALFVLVAPVLTSVALVGCSNNKMTYLSTPHSLKHVEIVDTVNGESVWSKDVPVNQKLTMDYNYDSFFEVFWANAGAPVTMDWSLHSIDSRGASNVFLGGKQDSGTVDLPGVPVRTVLSLREKQGLLNSENAGTDTASPPPSSQVAPDLNPSAQNQRPANAPAQSSNPTSTDDDAGMANEMDQLLSEPTDADANSGQSQGSTRDDNPDAEN